MITIDDFRKFKNKPEVIEGNLKAIERAYNEVKS